LDQYQHEIHFTLDEASEILPWVDESIRLVRTLFHQLTKMGFDTINGRWTVRGNGHSKGPPPDEYSQFIKVIGDLDKRGVIVKDFRIGLVDFPHIRPNGEEVYLCWMSGDEKIGFWHRISEGFMGRIPLEE
jgi:hypothetical protein